MKNNDADYKYVVSDDPIHLPTPKPVSSCMKNVIGAVEADVK